MYTNDTLCIIWNLLVNLVYVVMIYTGSYRAHFKDEKIKTQEVKSPEKPTVYRDSKSCTCEKYIWNLNCDTTLYTFCLIDLSNSFYCQQMNRHVYFSKFPFFLISQQWYHECLPQESLYTYTTYMSICILNCIRSCQTAFLSSCSHK